METVESKLGRPQMSRHMGDREIWVYRNNVRVTFDHGVMVADPNSPALAASADTATGPARPAPIESAATRSAPAAVNVQAAQVDSAPAVRTAVAPAAVAPASTGEPVVYRDEARHFGFTLPPGFERVPSHDPTYYALWIKQPGNGHGLRVVGLSELALPGKVPRGPIPPDKLPPGATVSMVPWRGEMLNCGRVEEKLPDGILLNLNLLMPTGEKALRLTFAGPLAEEADVRALMTATLPTLDVVLDYGPTAAEHFAEKLGELMGIVLVVAVVFALVRWARKKKAG